MGTLAITIGGDTPASVSLTSLVPLDTSAELLGGPAAMTLSGGAWIYEFDEPATGLTYRYQFTINWSDGSSVQEEGTFEGAALATLDAYATLSEADAIAAALPLLASYKAASGDARTAALAQATIDIDSAGPYQGRKYYLWTPQELEFPRVPYQSSAQVCGWGSLSAWLGSGYAGVQIWDWDMANNVAIVPAAVKRACVVQADSILKGDWQKALDAAAMGVASKSAGSVSISYRDPLAILQFLGGNGSLCRAAGQLLKKYLLKQGRVL